MDIKQVQDKIFGLVSEEKNKSPRNQIMNDLKFAIEEKKNFSFERKNLFDMNTDYKTEIDALRGEKSGAKKVLTIFLE